jgi:hypothetical protein
MVKITLLQIIERWNEDADEYNCWDELSEEEKVEFAYELGYNNGKDEVI